MGDLNRRRGQIQGMESRYGLYYRRLVPLKICLDILLICSHLVVRLFHDPITLRSSSPEPCTKYCRNIFS